MRPTDAANTPLTNRRTPASPVCVTEYAISPTDAASGARRQRVGGCGIREVGRDPTWLYPLLAPTATASTTTAAAADAAVQAGMPKSPGSTRWPTRGTACSVGATTYQPSAAAVAAGAADRAIPAAATSSRAAREAPSACRSASRRLKPVLTGPQQARAEDNHQPHPTNGHIDDSDAGVEPDVFGACDVLEAPPQVRVGADHAVGHEFVGRPDSLVAQGPCLGEAARQERVEPDALLEFRRDEPVSDGRVGRYAGDGHSVSLDAPEVNEYLLAPDRVVRDIRAQVRSLAGLGGLEGTYRGALVDSVHHDDCARRDARHERDRRGGQGHDDIAHDRGAAAAPCDRQSGPPDHRHWRLRRLPSFTSHVSSICAATAGSCVETINVAALW